MRRRGYAPIISIRSPVVENKVGTNGMATAGARCSARPAMLRLQRPRRVVREVDTLLLGRNRHARATAAQMCRWLDSSDFYFCARCDNYGGDSCGCAVADGALVGCSAGEAVVGGMVSDG